MTTDCVNMFAKVAFPCFLRWSRHPFLETCSPIGWECGFLQVANVALHKAPLRGYMHDWFEKLCNSRGGVYEPWFIYAWYWGCYCFVTKDKNQPIRKHDRKLDMDDGALFWCSIIHKSAEYNFPLFGLTLFTHLPALPTFFWTCFLIFCREEKSLT